MDLVAKYTSAKVAFVHSSPEDLFKVTYGRDLHAIRGVLAERMKVTFVMHMESNSDCDDHSIWLNKLRKQLVQIEPKLLNFVSNQSIDFIRVDQTIDILVLVQFWTRNAKLDFQSLDQLTKNHSKLIRLIFYEEKQERIEMMNAMTENDDNHDDDDYVYLLVRVS